MQRCFNCQTDSTGLYCPACGEKKATSLVFRPGYPPAGRDNLVEAAPPASNLQRTVNVHETLPIELIDDSPLQKIRSGSVTRRAAEVMRATDEEMVWEESPSPVLLASTASKYLAAIFGAALLAGFLHTGWYWAGFCLLIGMVHVGIGCLKLRCMSYRLSSQRLEITQGVLNQKTVTWEVHQLGSSEISSPLTLRLFQRSTLVITNPFIELSGIRESRRVRDFLRNTGQSEAQRVDKIRWR